MGIPIQPGQSGATDRTQSTVFLSSCFLGRQDQRQRIYELGRRRGVDVWIAERACPELRCEPPEGILDVCLEAVRSSKALVGIVDARYGGSANLQPAGVAAGVSYLELELFQAALHRKPMRLFVVEGDALRDPRLDSLLGALNVIHPAVVTVGAEAELMESLSSYLDSLACDSRPGRAVGRVRRFTGWLVQELARRRSRVLDPGAGQEDVRFLDHSFFPISRDFDPQVVRDALTAAGTAASKHRELAFLWMALRHLAGRPFDDTRNREFAPLWHACLSRWSEAAAWTGLHGHLLAGRLAAVNSVQAIRESYPEVLRHVAQIDVVQGSRASRASEYYSIARSAPRARDRRLLLDRARRECELALDTEPLDRSSAVSILAGVELAVGHPRKAVSLYREVLASRQGEARGRVGEAESNLGYALLRAGHWVESGQRLRRGLELLKQSPRTTFTVRALRRSALFHILTLRWGSALRLLREAHELCVEHGIDGQRTALVQFAAWVSVRRR